MKKYLTTLHTKSDAHKKRFALLTSGSATLLIFALWSTVHFATYGSVTANHASESKVAEVSPFASLRANVATGLEGLSATFGSLKQNVVTGVEQLQIPTSQTQEATSTEASYTQLQNGQIEIYGQ